LKGVTVKELAEITTKNFYTLFALAAKKRAA
ncbi:MAG TPA: metal-dependent hydrolase, partial [Alteromonas macleodii]|nr:metal-dependent hydrolase [Alteromonas macleodii]